MARDANGNYTLPAGNPVAAGTVISTTWANPTLSDIAQALTDSLSRNGDGGMLVPFANVDGDVALPGISWTLEPSTGLYREANNDMQAGVAGSRVTRWFNDTAVANGDQNPFQIWDGLAWRDAIRDNHFDPITFRGLVTMTGGLTTSLDGAGATVVGASFKNGGGGASTRVSLDFYAANTLYGRIIGGYGVSQPELLLEVNGSTRVTINGSDTSFAGTVTGSFNGAIGGLTPNTGTFTSVTVSSQVKVDSAAQAFFIADRGSNVNNAIMRLYTNGTEEWRVGMLSDGTSNFHVATAGAIPRFTIDAAGDATFSGSVTVAKPSATNQVVIHNNTPGSVVSPQYTDIEFQGWTGTPRARIRGVDISSNFLYGGLVFQTYDTSSQIDRMFIDGTGDLTIYQDDGTSAGVFFDASTAAATFSGSVTGASFVINSTGAAATFNLNNSGVNVGYIGTAVTPGSLINQSTAGDILLRSDGNDFLFSTDSGATTAFRLASTGAATFSGAVTITNKATFADGITTLIGRGSSASDVTLRLNGGGTQTQRGIVFAVDDGDYGFINIPAGGGGDMTFGTGSIGAAAERLRISATGAATFSGTVSAASGVYVGGTAAANLLDDYEEGTWTPGQGTFTTWTSPTFSAKYTKVGRVVTLSIQQTGGTITAGGAAKYMTGVPFASDGQYAGSVSSSDLTDYGKCVVSGTLLFFSDNIGVNTVITITYMTTL